MERRKSKFFFLCSIIVLSFSLFSVLMLSGCKIDKKTKISILSHKAEIDRQLQDLCRIYEKNNPNIKIELQSISGGNDYESNLLSKLNSNSVDMFFVEGFGNMMNLRNRLLNLSKMSIVQECNPEILDAVTDENKNIFGFPVAIEGYGNLVNKAAFDAIGVDVSQIKTFAEFEEACNKLRDSIRSGQLKDKFPNAKTVWKFPGKASWSYGNHALHVFLSRDFKNSIEAYNSPEVPFSLAEAYKKLIDFQTGLSVEGEPNKDSIANLNAVDYSASFDGSFLTGQSFVCQQGTWVVPQIEKYDKDNKTSFMQQVDLLPYYIPEYIPDDSRLSKYVVSSGQFWAINNSSSREKILECEKFLEWLYKSEVASKKLFEAKLISPLLKKDDLKNMKFDNVSKRIVDAYLSGNYIKGGSVGLVRGEGWSLKVFGTAVQEYLAGKIPFGKVIERAKVGWKEKYDAQMKSKN